MQIVRNIIYLSQKIKWKEKVKSSTTIFDVQNFIDVILATKNEEL